MNQSKGPAATSNTIQQNTRKLVETQRIETTYNPALMKKPDFSKTTTAAQSNDLSIQNALKKSVGK